MKSTWLRNEDGKPRRLPVPISEMTLSENVKDILCKLKPEQLVAVMEEVMDILVGGEPHAENKVKRAVYEAIGAERRKCGGFKLPKIEEVRRRYS